MKYIPSTHRLHRAASLDSSMASIINVLKLDSNCLKLSFATSWFSRSDVAIAAVPAREGGFDPFPLLDDDVDIRRLAPPFN